MSKAGSYCLLFLKNGAVSIWKNTKGDQRSSGFEQSEKPWMRSVGWRVNSHAL